MFTLYGIRGGGVSNEYDSQYPVVCGCVLPRPVPGTIMGTILVRCSPCLSFRSVVVHRPLFVEGTLVPENRMRILNEWGRGAGAGSGESGECRVGSVI
jgi:hypothetical protein